MPDILIEYKRQHTEHVSKSKATLSVDTKENRTNTIGNIEDELHNEFEWSFR